MKKFNSMLEIRVGWGWRVLTSMMMVSRAYWAAMKTTLCCVRRQVMMSRTGTDLYDDGEQGVLGGDEDDSLLCEQAGDDVQDGGVRVGVGVEQGVLGCDEDDSLLCEEAGDGGY